MKKTALALVVALTAGAAHAAPAAAADRSPASAADVLVSLVGAAGALVERHHGVDLLPLTSVARGTRAGVTLAHYRGPRHGRGWRHRHFRHGPRHGFRGKPCRIKTVRYTPRGKIVRIVDRCAPRYGHRRHRHW